MVIDNLVIKRLIIHEVFRRRDDKQPVKPRYGGQLINLTADAMDALRDRIVDALGNQSQSMDMMIVDAGAGSVVSISSGLLKCNDAKFIADSQALADRLTSVQANRSLPGGILVVFQASVGHPAKEAIGVIKAETHGGFTRHQQPAGLTLEYLKDLLLTPQAKLYKIGLFVNADKATSTALPDGWSAAVYDSNMTASRDGAAQYFYGVFLGCGIPINSAKLTKQFFEDTREFIKKSDIPQEERADLITGLYTYLKVDQSPTVEVATFATQYLQANLRDEYRVYMTGRKFPLNSVQKDLTDIQSVLKQRRLVFTSNIRLTASSEAFNERIKIETIAGEADVQGIVPEWTRILIRDRIREQE